MKPTDFRQQAIAYASLALLGYGFWLMIWKFWTITKDLPQPGYLGIFACFFGSFVIGLIAARATSGSDRTGAMILAVTVCVASISPHVYENLERARKKAAKIRISEEYRQNSERDHALRVPQNAFVPLVLKTVNFKFPYFATDKRNYRYNGKIGLGGKTELQGRLVRIELQFDPRTGSDGCHEGMAEMRAADYNNPVIIQAEFGRWCDRRLDGLRP